MKYHTLEIKQDKNRFRLIRDGKCEIASTPRTAKGLIWLAQTQKAYTAEHETIGEKLR